MNVSAHLQTRWKLGPITAQIQAAEAEAGGQRDNSLGEKADFWTC